MKCPFCGEDDFDEVGLKAHLTGEGMMFGTGCQMFENTFTLAEEQKLREIQTGLNSDAK